MKQYLTVCNLLTATRLVGAICLFALLPQDAWFYVIYTVCGVTDVLDGWIARRTGSCTSFGAKLDSVADLTFYAAMLIRCLPLLGEILPTVIWIAVGCILLLRLVAYLSVAIKFHRFASPHSIWNKVTGLLVFCVPYLMHNRSLFLGYSVVVCVVALLAALQELWADFTSQRKQDRID